MQTIQQITEFILALAGASACAVWHWRETRKQARVAAFLWGCWCILLAAFRVARWLYPVTANTEQALLFNALANWLFILGAASALIVAVSCCIEGRKHHG